MVLCVFSPKHKSLHTVLCVCISTENIQFYVFFPPKHKFAYCPALCFLWPTLCFWDRFVLTYIFLPLCHPTIHTVLLQSKYIVTMLRESSNHPNVCSIKTFLILRFFPPISPFFQNFCSGPGTASLPCLVSFAPWFPDAWFLWRTPLIIKPKALWNLSAPSKNQRGSISKSSTYSDFKHRVCVRVP